jgi:hypothetical protein
MEPNRTSSFPAAIKKIPPTVWSVAMTVATVVMTVVSFARGEYVAGWILAAASIGQVFLFSVIVANQRHINNRDKPTAGT